TLLEHGWNVVNRNWGTAASASGVRSTTLISPVFVRFDADYWKGRLIHRKYPEPSHSQRAREFSVRIEQARTSHYFPLGTSDESAAAARAIRIYQMVVNEGWASAKARFPRELSLA